MSRKVFTSQKLTIFLSGKEFRVQALVSTFGAKYVFDDGDLPEEARTCFGLEIPASYKGIPMRCRFVRETNRAGSIYGLRFINPSNLLLRQIEKDIAVSGLPSPWMRGLPRLSTTAKHLPVPVLATVNYNNGAFYLNVRNFTLGGLLLDYVGSDFADLKIGAVMELDLVTNGGEKLSEIAVKVTHISAEVNETTGDANRFQFGVKFVSMSVGSEAKYRTMIREHCQGLKSELAPEAAL